MAAFYTRYALNDAKCILWSKFEENYILERMQSRQTSCNRTDKEAVCDDTLRALSSLLENDIKVQFVAHDWKTFPRGISRVESWRETSRP